MSAPCAVVSLCPHCWGSLSQDGAASGLVHPDALPILLTAEQWWIGRAGWDCPEAERAAALRQTFAVGVFDVYEDGGAVH